MGLYNWKVEVGNGEGLQSTMSAVNCMFCLKEISPQDGVSGLSPSPQPKRHTFLQRAFTTFVHGKTHNIEPYPYHPIPSGKLNPPIKMIKMENIFFLL